MNEFDLDRLGDVWRQQLDPAELERLQRTAAAVRRRARLASIVDVGAAVIVGVVVVLLVLSSPKADTIAIGSAAILVLLISNIRLRRLREVELRSLAGTTEAMLDQSIERVESTLRYRRFVLVAAVPTIVIGNMVASSAERSLGSLVDSLRAIPGFPIAWGIFWLTVLAGMAVFMALSIRRGRRELARLKAMRDAYRQEGESSTRP
jgi:hypothetical protein